MGGDRPDREPGLADEGTVAHWFHGLPSVAAYIACVPPLVTCTSSADSIGMLLQTEYNGANFWDLRNGWDTGNNNSASLYGWRQGGDYGSTDVIGEVAQNDRRACRRQPLLALENIAQALAVDAPHNEVEQSVALARGVDVDDAGVTQPGDRARLA